MLSKFFGCSAVAAAALLVGTMPALAHDGHDNMCGGVMESDADMVATNSGKPLLLGSSAPCPEEEKTAAVETETTNTVAAAPVELPHEGMVYFALDSAELAAEDQAMLDEIIAAVKEGGPEKIVVRGHADRSGDDAYNLALSQERAEIIAAALVAAGISEDSVRTMGLGETKPAVETEDGVAMRQ
ncbi:MAG: OmpA family protein, partial [Geminicoccaceae bacterium]